MSLLHGRTQRYASAFVQPQDALKEHCTWVMASMSRTMCTVGSPMLCMNYGHNADAERVHAGVHGILSTFIVFPARE